MPATEKTWYDQALLHVIFGITALVLLGGTIWMLAKDHNREWRKWQLDDRARERWTIQAQLAQAHADSVVAMTRLQKDLDTARSGTIDVELIKRFEQLVSTENERLTQAGRGEEPTDFARLDGASTALQQAEAGSSVALKARQNVIGEMASYISEAKRREGALLTAKKFRAADQTAAISARGIAVRDGKPTEEIEAKIATLKQEIAQYDVDVASAKDYRVALETLVKQVQGPELEWQKQIAALQTEQNRLRENLGKFTTTAGEWVNRGPVLDALYTGNIKLEQIWLPDMKINYNFSQVARYDRCIVCHRAIDKTAPGSATEPAYPAISRAERERTVQLNTPAEAPKTETTEGPADALATVYGITLAPRGQVEASATTIQVVAPQSLAAIAGLQMGDVLLEINGGPITSQEDVRHYLLEVAEWGKPIAVKIRRGLNQPFTSHPRLDLFVGSTSPHKKGEMGCTICHDGQGSATEFKWASHTPNDPQQARDWTRQYGWFNNHHWIFPMTPDRFIESNCLKCHHEVVDLMPSERFPEPPAPKLVKGYELVREYGCYGCHEINGFDGPLKRTGPDLRAEPNCSEIASQILTDKGLTPVERDLATQVVAQPTAAAPRNELIRSIRADANGGPKEGDGDQKPAQPRLTPATLALADALKDVEAPGNLRKVGPSLRHLNSKVDFGWVYSWVRKPSDFRPTTRMPQFFLNHEHLNGEAKSFKIRDAAGKEIEISDLEYTQRFEQIEIRALSQFMLSNSQPFDYIRPPQGITEEPSRERGKKLFETRGCLACHSHGDFNQIHATQGPDLSRLASKLNTEKGRQWLYSWLKAPNHYYPRTAMPIMYLDPIVEKDANGAPTGKVSDPAADVMAYLLSVPSDWKPEVDVPSAEMTAAEKAALNDLTTVWLSASFPRLRAERFAKEGIDRGLASSVKVDERVMLGPFQNDEDRARRQLEYVGRRSLSRYGCFGCHDIPGYELAKPIGTPLASWGRKDTSQLAFENIGQFLAMHEEFIPKRNLNTGEAAASEDGDAGHGEAGEAAASSAASVDHQAAGDHATGHGVDPLDERFDSDTGYFLQALNNHERNGFLWQKLRMPRSFDYETTKTKRYDERLRMPKFPFNAEQREAIMTFVLGLTAEAPATKYIYQPLPRQKAIIEGRHVLDKFNCAGCHILDMERWDVAFAPNQFEAPPATSDYPFLQPGATPEQMKASVTVDKRGMLHAELHGMPVRDEATGAPRLVDADGVAIEPDDKESPRFFEFSLFQPAVVNGEVRKVGVQNLKIPATLDGRGLTQGTAYPGLGGVLAKYLYPRVIADEKQNNPNVVPTEAWGWLPPPLHNEGEKVQTDWLHDFLMDPTMIRPAAMLRMPNFHMTSEEASTLVNYFAAKSSAEFPYEYNVRRRIDYLSGLEKTHPAVLNDAMKIVTDGNYCVKCHFVGDYQVRGAVRAMAPNLDQVYRRLRPEYVNRWIANPQRILPYTGMPVNIPYDPTPPNFGGISQDLFRGPSTAQLEGIVSLLMNFDAYTGRQTSVKSLVKEPPPPAGQAPAGQPPAAQPPAAAPASAPPQTPPPPAKAPA